ncbi:unnamed protein product [Prunus armeniaca]|uniref:Uncharacterized protein n=1 Tax=Prunus armeniaca TaxID=36596 RepID=A0A6J5W2Y9_PRUAR|nr:unnamed protein product [Prunus armeniaca]
MNFSQNIAFVCGCVGHPSYLCLEQHHEEYGSSGVRSEALLAFVGLAAEDDLRGRKLKGSV